jgi:hypothetical protein
MASLDWLRVGPGAVVVSSRLHIAACHQALGACKHTSLRIGTSKPANVLVVCYFSWVRMHRVTSVLRQENEGMQERTLDL